MEELLESVKTAELDTAIKKYLPMVLKEENTHSRYNLTEAKNLKTVTGDKKLILESDEDSLDDVRDEVDRIVFLGTK